MVMVVLWSFMNKFVFLCFLFVSSCANNQDDAPQRRQEHNLTCGPALPIYEMTTIEIKMCTTLTNTKEPDSLYIVIQGSLK